MLQPFLPGPKRRGCPRLHSPPEILNAVFFYVLKSGCQWRMLPRRFPRWKTVFTTHLRVRTRKPLGGMRLYQSTAYPSLAHSATQSSATFSGTGLGGLRTTSTLKPITPSAQRLPLP